MPVGACQLEKNYRLVLVINKVLFRHSLFILKVPLSGFLVNEKLDTDTTLEVLLCLYIFSLPVGFIFLNFWSLNISVITTFLLKRKNVDVFYINATKLVSS